MNYKFIDIYVDGYFYKQINAPSDIMNREHSQSEISGYIEERLPSLRTRKYNIELSNQRANRHE